MAKLIYIIINTLIIKYRIYLLNLTSEIIMNYFYFLKIRKKNLKIFFIEKKCDSNVIIQKIDVLFDNIDLGLEHQGQHESELKIFENNLNKELIKIGKPGWFPQFRDKILETFKTELEKKLKNLDRNFNNVYHLDVDENSKIDKYFLPYSPKKIPEITNPSIEKKNNITIK